MDTHQRSGGTTTLKMETPPIYTASFPEDRNGQQAEVLQSEKLGRNFSTACKSIQTLTKSLTWK